jgi:hypothetical protein
MMTIIVISEKDVFIFLVNDMKECFDFIYNDRFTDLMNINVVGFVKKVVNRSDFLPQKMGEID